MKKTILAALAAMLLAVPAVQAQKVNKEALLSKIEKSDEAVADAKKGAKAATWIARGKATTMPPWLLRRASLPASTERCSNWPTAIPNP